MDSKSIFKKLTKTGKEILNRTPISIPLGFSRPKSITEQIAEFVTNQKFKSNSMLLVLKLSRMLKILKLVMIMKAYRNLSMKLISTI